MCLKHACLTAMAALAPGILRPPPLTPTGSEHAGARPRPCSAAARARPRAGRTGSHRLQSPAAGPDGQNQYPRTTRPALAWRRRGLFPVRASVPRCQWMNEAAGADEVDCEAYEQTCCALPQRRLRTAGSARSRRGIAAFLSGSRLGAKPRPSGGGDSSDDRQRRGAACCGPSHRARLARARALVAHAYVSHP